MRASFVDAWRWWCDLHHADSAPCSALDPYCNDGFLAVFNDIDLAYIALQVPKMAALDCIGDLKPAQKVIDSFNTKSVVYSKTLTAYAMALDVALARYIAATSGENADAFQRLPREMVVSQLRGLFAVNGLAMSFPELQNLTYEEGGFLAAVGDLHDALLARQGGNTEAACVYLVRAAQYGAFNRTHFEKRREKQKSGQQGAKPKADKKAELKQFVIDLVNTQHKKTPFTSRAAARRWVSDESIKKRNELGLPDIEIQTADRDLESWIKESNVLPRSKTIPLVAS